MVSYMDKDFRILGTTLDLLDLHMEVFYNNIYIYININFKD